jgi:3-oxoacyl-[acyl-carrier protein] reductase
MDAAPVALITGARKGIGRALAAHFLAQGYQVAGCSRQPADWTAPGYTHHLADVADVTAVKTLFAAIRKQYGRLDVVINNAGAASMNAALLTPAATLDRLLAVNVRGTFLVSREAAKLMQKARRGRIVNLTTVAVPLRLEGEAAYVAAKSAIEGLTRVLARELAPLGITCNAVGPTPIATDLIAGVPPDKIQQIVDRLAIPRLGRFEDVINAIDFFVRPESDYVTGQILYLGGVG